MKNYNLIVSMEKPMDYISDEPPLTAEKGDDKPPGSKQIPMESNNLHYTPLDISPCGRCIGDRVVRMVRKVPGKYSIIDNSHLFSIRNPGGYFILATFVAGFIPDKE